VVASKKKYSNRDAKNEKKLFFTIFGIRRLKFC
jgi:hypothetical protein